MGTTTGASPGAARPAASEVLLTAIHEVANNSMYGADTSAFHVKLATGSNFNFVGLNDQLQFFPTDSIVLEIRGAIP